MCTFHGYHCFSVGTYEEEGSKDPRRISQNLKKCPFDDSKAMTNGLSFILDLCDQSLNSQQRLFSPRQWHDLVEQFFFLEVGTKLVEEKSS